MDTRLLKRTCESLIEASQDLVKDEHTTENLKKNKVIRNAIIVYVLFYFHI